MIQNSKSFFHFSIALVLTSGLALAQSQPPANGGWRRAGDAPPSDSQSNPAAQMDPTQPIDRSDSFGQPPQSFPQSAPQAASRPYGVPPEITVKQGTFFTVRTIEPLESNRNKPGDVFTATLTAPLIASGIVVAQAGQTVVGTVAEVGKNKDGQHFIRVQLNAITASDGSQIPVQTHLASMHGGSTPGGVEAGTVIATTATGAMIGGIAGWGTGAAIGAGAGALVGLAAVVATHNHPAVIYPETALTFQIVQPVTVSTVNAPQAFRYAGPEDFQPQLTRGPAAPRPYPGAAYGPSPAYPGYAYPPAAYVYAAPGYYYPGYYRPYPYYWGRGAAVVHGGYRHW
jgi:hypothetical protein